MFYACQIDGPSSVPGLSWHNFDSEMILVDPHARVVPFPPNFDREGAQQPGSNDAKHRE